MKNRELKFRAWDAQTHAMIYFDLDDLQRNLFSVRELASRNNWSNPVMQSTGLKDKNGKEIYEGDILNRLMYPPDENGNYNSIPVFIKGNQVEVGFNEGCFIGKPSYHLWRYICYYDDSTKTDYEIIGNIYENPELLKP